MKAATPFHLKVGRVGELLAQKHLLKEGYKIIQTNYKEKWGEIDIIAFLKKLLVFVEVKTIINYNFHLKNAFLKPEDQVTFKKLNNLEKTILHYLNKNHLENDYRLDLIAIEINPEIKKYRLRHFKGIK
jgi:Predicted endonuclease distantly related to archaeal Holliday junction resolvase